MEGKPSLTIARNPYYIMKSLAIEGTPLLYNRRKPLTIEGNALRIKHKSFMGIPRYRKKSLTNE